jgi:hypothetical protein
MELTERIESINRQLRSMFGIDTETRESIFRVVWSEDQFEKRLSNYTASGIQLLTPLVCEMPKYRQWVQEKYVLERLVVVPETSSDELLDAKKSYEPLWVFRDNKGNYLPPKLEVCKLVIDTLYAALGKKSMAKYVDEEAKNPIEKSKERIDKLEEELFGDESGLLGRTITGEAIAMPQQYIKEN